MDLIGALPTCQAMLRQDVEQVEGPAHVILIAMIIADLPVAGAIEERQSGVDRLLARSIFAGVAITRPRMQVLVVQHRDAPRVQQIPGAPLPAFRHVAAIERR